MANSLNIRYKKGLMALLFCVLLIGGEFGVAQLY